MKFTPQVGLYVGALAALTTVAQAVPTISVTPPDKSRFLVGQRFDLRVEGKPATGSAITAGSLSVDGTPVTFSSSDSFSGVTGYNLRAYSNTAPGVHTLTASLTDGTGTATATAKFLVINPNGGRRQSKNIIIMLGDGMGAAHRTAARIVMGGYSANQSVPLLNMDGFPGTGMVMTSSLNSIVTDSAPGMSCYSSGSHANNGQEGVYPATFSSPFAQPRVEYLAEYLHRLQGKTLGLVSTADIEDATPAANIVHTGNRNLGQGICDQYLDEIGNSGLTVLMGGGRRWFLPSTSFGSSRSANNDVQKFMGVSKLQERQGRDAHGTGVNLHYDFPPYSVNEVCSYTHLLTSHCAVTLPCIELLATSPEGGSNGVEHWR